MDFQLISIWIEFRNEENHHIVNDTIISIDFVNFADYFNTFSSYINLHIAYFNEVVLK